MNHFARFATTAGVVLGAAALAAPALAQGDARPTVAIMFFNNSVFSKDARDYEGLTKGIADFLTTEMASNPGIRVIERDQVQRFFDLQKLAAGSQVDRETAVRIGKQVGAQHVVFGRFMADPRGNFRIDARVVGVEHGEIEYSERVQDKSDNVMELVGALAAKLNAGMQLPPIAARAVNVGNTASATALPAGAPAASSRLPMKYAVMYGTALDLADRGDKTRALELFSAVLKDYPDFEPAKKARARLAPGG